MRVFGVWALGSLLIWSIDNEELVTQRLEEVTVMVRDD